MKQSLKCVKVNTPNDKLNEMYPFRMYGSHFHFRTEIIVDSAENAKMMNMINWSTFCCKSSSIRNRVSLYSTCMISFCLLL